MIAIVFAFDPPEDDRITGAIVDGMVVAANLELQGIAEIKGWVVGSEPAAAILELVDPEHTRHPEPEEQ